jgi:hypothetical protein
MVLLCNENPINIKNNHMLKCLNKKKENFNIFIVPLEETLKEQNKDEFINLNITFDEKEIKKLNNSIIHNPSK